jgi:hypothetical protein
MRFLAACGLWLWGVAGLVSAKTPIDAPVTIDKPGSYVVRRNLRSLEFPVLVVTASNVVIDLDGHALTTERALCCVVSIQTATGVRIENGSIVGEGQGLGISATASPELVIANLTLDQLATAVRAVDSRATTLRHNRVTRDVAVGFDLAGSSGFVIEDNTIEAATGVLLNASSSSIARNFFGGELLGAPLVLGPGARDVSVRDNVVRSNGPGIVVHGSANLLQDNVINPAGCSLWFKPGSRDNLYRRNTARGPSTGCDCPTTARGSLCDEGQGNLSAGDNYLPDGR